MRQNYSTEKPVEEKSKLIKLNKPVRTLAPVKERSKSNLKIQFVKKGLSRIEIVGQKEEFILDESGNIYT